MTREKRKIAAEEFKEWRDSYYNKNKLPATMFIEDVIKILEQDPCDEAISRQAVDILVDELARAISDERCCMSRGRSTATIMQDILDLPSVNPQEPKWIPVSERLPEESDRYLAYIVNKYDDKLRYIMTCDYSADGYWNWFPDDACASDNVIAWMPLPAEPYKAESEEEV